MPSIEVCENGQGSKQTGKVGKVWATQSNKKREESRFGRFAEKKVQMQSKKVITFTLERALKTCLVLVSHASLSKPR